MLCIIYLLKNNMYKNYLALNNTKRLTYNKTQPN